MTGSALVPWTAEPETLFSVGFHWHFPNQALRMKIRVLEAW